MSETMAPEPIGAILEWVYIDRPAPGAMCIPANTGGAPPVAVLVAAERQGLVTATPDALVLTSAGEEALALYWGSDRNPPGVGGYYDCDRHGVYDSHPGDLKGCPDCWPS
jgi:hypothetical protein